MSTDTSQRDNRNCKTTDFWTEFLDGFLARILWTDVWDGFLDGCLGRIFGRILQRQAGWIWRRCGTKLLWAFQIPHLNFTSVWWHFGRPMSPPFEPDPFSDRALIASCTTPSLNLHNVPKTLLPSFSLTLSLYLCVILFVF